MTITTGKTAATGEPAAEPSYIDSDLSLDFLRVVEQAAIACAHTMGQGDRHKSDQVAVEAMRREMDSVPIDGTIVIGEGERDEAPMLYIGEKVGMAARAESASHLPHAKIPASRATRTIAFDERLIGPPAQDACCETPRASSPAGAVPAP